MARLTAVLFLRFCIQYASVALLYYDYILTFPREFKLIWRRRLTLATVLYVACRYAMVANVIYTLALAEKLSMRICAILSVIGRLAILTVWGARTYAVFNRSRLILCIFVPLGLFISVLATMYIPYIACNGSKGSPPEVTNYLALCTVIYEALSTVLTTFRGLQSIRIDGTWTFYRQGLIYLIVEQGLVYFGLVSGFSIAAVILQHVGTPGTFTQRLLNAFTLPLSGLMTARFLLHLREWEDHTPKSTSTSIILPGIESIPIEFRVPDNLGTRFSDTDIELQRTYRRRTPSKDGVRARAQASTSAVDNDEGRSTKCNDEVFHAL